jgi:DNA primase
VFDLEGYLAGYGGARSVGVNGIQYLLNCPWCGSRDLYVAVEPHQRSYKARPTRPGDFICFKGKCGRAGGFVALFSELEGLTYKEAKIQLVLARAGKIGRVAPPPPRAAASARVDAAAKTIEGGGCALPAEFIPCWDGHRWRVPKYLTGRGLTRETVKAFGLGFCNEGRYQGRIVIPITCPAGTSFTTRAIDPGEPRRYLAGPGAGSLLFGWPQAQGANELVIVEGSFDAMSAFQAGVKAVAILGKTLRESQITMLRGCGARRLVLMLDGDALDDALRQAPMVGSSVVVAAPLGAKDPAQAVEDGEPELIRHAVDGAVPLREARIARMAERLQLRRSRST